MTSSNAPIRTRWSAIGAAVAITLGAGGLGVVGATINSGERTSFVPIQPCRLLDTRPAPNTVGARSTPLGPGDQYTVDAHGPQGNCDITAEATGLVLNVTAVGATEVTNVRVFPADATLPTTSNLNPSPGQPPTPNSVTTDIDADGRFVVYNEFGSVNLITDVVGYYEDHNHDDRYYTKVETNNRLGASPTKLVVNGAEFSPNSPTSDFVRAGSVYGFMASSTNCATAPVDLPHFATVDEVNVSYATGAAGLLTVLLYGTPWEGGVSANVPAAFQKVVESNAIPLVGPDTTVHIANAPVTADNKINRKSDVYAVMLCTDQTVGVSAVTIDYTPA